MYSGEEYEQHMRYVHTVVRRVPVELSKSVFVMAFIVFFVMENTKRFRSPSNQGLRLVLMRPRISMQNRCQSYRLCQLMFSVESHYSHRQTQSPTLSSKSLQQCLHHDNHIHYYLPHIHIRTPNTTRNNMTSSKLNSNLLSLFTENEMMSGKTNITVRDLKSVNH